MGSIYANNIDGYSPLLQQRMDKLQIIRDEMGRYVGFITYHVGGTKEPVVVLDGDPIAMIHAGLCGLDNIQRPPSTEYADTISSLVARGYLFFDPADYRAEIDELDAKCLQRFDEFLERLDASGERNNVRIVDFHEPPVYSVEEAAGVCCEV